MKSPREKKKRRSMDRSLELDSDDDLRRSIGLESGISDRHVEIKLTEKVAIKVPLIGSSHIVWITEHIINNHIDFQPVYQRREFQNSQELIGHNLKEKPDPLFKQPKKPIRVPVLGSQVVEASPTGGSPTVQTRRPSLFKNAESPLGILS